MQFKHNFKDSYYLACPLSLFGWTCTGHVRSGFARSQGASWWSLLRRLINMLEWGFNLLSTFLFSCSFHFFVIKPEFRCVLSASWISYLPRQLGSPYVTGFCGLWHFFFRVLMLPVSDWSFRCVSIGFCRVYNLGEK